MRSAPSAPYSPRHPFQDGTKGQGRKRLLSSKRPMRLSKITPRPDRRATRDAASDRQRAAPHRCGTKELVPKGTGSGICSRTALHFRRPGITPEGIIGRTGRSNRSAAGGLTWRPKAPVSRSHPNFPERNHLATGIRDGAFRLQLQDLVTRFVGEGAAFRQVTRNGATQPNFKAWKTKPQRQEAPLPGKPEMVPLSPDFKLRRSGVLFEDRITVKAEMVASAPFSSLPDAAPETAPSRGGRAI
jgi:hypothetical protein